MNFLKIAGAVFLWASPLARTAAAQEPPKPVGFLIASLQAYTAKFAAVEGDLAYRILNSQQAVVSTDKAHWQRQEGKERLDVVEVPGADPAAKGKTYENFSVGNTSAIYEPEQKMAILRPDKAYMPLAFKPDEMLLLTYQGRAWSEYLQEPKAAAHVVADEAVNQLPCEVVQFDLVSNGKPNGDDVRIYFAKILGYAPVKMTFDDKQGDRSAVTLQYPTTEGSGPAAPERAVYEAFSGARKVSAIECRVEKLTFNPAPADLAFRLPAGTLVNDMISKKHYLVK